MREHSEYHVTCIKCGAALVSPLPEMKCKCGAVLRVEWPAQLQAAVKK